MPRPYADHTTVQYAADGNVLIVGEEHRNPDSEWLANRLLEEFEGEISTVAMEAAGVTSGAMGVARQHANTTSGLSSHRIDLPRSEIVSEIGLLAAGNEFVEEMDDTGDIPYRSVEAARTRVKEEFGYDVYHNFYLEREHHMAEELQRLLQNRGGVVFAAMGAFHAPTVATFVDEVEYPAGTPAADTGTNEVTV